MKDLDKLKEKILEHVDLATLLKEGGVIQSDISEEQIHCPFHGPDSKKSSRFYRKTDSIYCWTCKQSWDLFSYLIQKEGTSFRDVLENLVKKYKVDISKVPDAIEGAKQKRLKTKQIKYDTKKLYLEKLHNIITDIRDDIPKEKYVRLIFAFMLLKHSTADEKFEESIIKIRDAVLRLKKGVING